MISDINLSFIKYQSPYSSDSEDYESATEELDIKRNENLFNVEDFPPELGVYILKKLNDVALVKMREVSYEWKQLIDGNSYLVARIAFKFFTSRVDKISKENIFYSARYYTDLAELDASYYMKAKTAVKNYGDSDAYAFDKFTLKLIKIEIKVFQNLNAASESYKQLKLQSNKIKACKKFSSLQSELIKESIFKVRLDESSITQACSYFLKLGDLDFALRLHEKYPKHSGCIIKILKKYPYHLNDDKTNESFDPKLVQTIQNLYQKIIGFNHVPIDFHIQNLQTVAKHNPQRAEKEALELLERKIDFSLEGPICVIRTQNTELKIYFKSEDRAKIICFIAEINPIMGLKMLKDFLSNLDPSKDVNLILRIQFAIAKITKDFSNFNIDHKLYSEDFFNEIFIERFYRGEIFKQLIIHNPARAFQILDIQDDCNNEYIKAAGLIEIAGVLKNEEALRQILEIPDITCLNDYINYFKLNSDLNFLMKSFKNFEKGEDKYRRPQGYDYVKGAKLSKEILDTYKET